MPENNIEYLLGTPEEKRDEAAVLYERNGFVETKTEHFSYLRWLLGFGASTTMVYKLSLAQA